MALIWPHPRARTPDLRSMNFTVFVEGSFDIIAMHLVFSHVCGIREEDFLKIKFFGGDFCIFGPACGAVGWKSHEFYNLNFNNWHCSFKEVENVKLLTHGGRRTTMDENG